MSMQLQSTSTVLSVSLNKIEPQTAIKNEPFESEIGIDDIPNSLDEEIIPDVKETDIVSHELSEDLIKSETVFENTFEYNYSGSVETQVFVKTENIPLIKTENITQCEYLYKTQDRVQDSRDGNVSRGTSQEVQSDKQFINCFKDLSDTSRTAKHPDKNKTVKTTSCEKDKKKGNVIEVPVIPLEPHKYTSLAKAKHTSNENKSAQKQNEKRFCCEKCTYTSGKSSSFKLHQLTHKTKAEIDDRLLKYRCDKCKYKTYWRKALKVHKLTHLKPEEIHYFHCYHCSYKCKQRINLQTHIFRHFDNEDVPFHCYICDFVTLKRNLIVEHFKKHPKHDSKCNETYYKNQLKIPYFYCYLCSYKCKLKSGLKVHIFNHFKKEEVSFHCYICDFTTLKRNLIIDHFKKHPKHQSKCDETDYKNHCETYTKNQMRYCCENCTYTSERSFSLKLHQLTHKTKSEIDDRLLKYRCDKCQYKTYVCSRLKAHKLTHLKPEEINYFHCYHCSYKCKEKASLQTHIFRHFKNEVVPFQCYICDFVTLKRDLIIKHFKTHAKNHSKYDETEYNYQLEICNKRYPYEKYTYTSGKSSAFKLHQLTHKTKAEMDDRLSKYRCDKCKYKTHLCSRLKTHKLIHLKPEEIHYFYCYHCSFKSKYKSHLKTHIFRHFKNGNVPLHCYICDFVTLQRESFKKHLKHHNRSDETEYRNQLQ